MPDAVARERLAARDLIIDVRSAYFCGWLAMMYEYSILWSRDSYCVGTLGGRRVWQSIGDEARWIITTRAEAVEHYIAHQHVKKVRRKTQDRFKMIDCVKIVLIGVAK